MKKGLCTLAVFFGVLFVVSAQWETKQENGGLVITGYTGNATAITIPDKINGAAVVGIGDWAFSESPLTSITLPNSVTTIGAAPFAGCSNLTAIAVDVRNPAFSSVDGVLFSKDMKTLIAYPGGKSSSYTIPNGVTTIGDEAFAGTQLTSVTIPNSVTAIGDAAFADTQLTSIMIGNSVTSIWGTTFAGCSSLTAIAVDVRNPAFSSVDGVLFSKDTKTLIAYPGGKSSSYTIPNGVTAIGDFAFAWTQLTRITIPNGLTAIGDSAFTGTQLTSVTIPASVTAIGDWAFSFTPLTSVTIPDSVTSIGDSAFTGTQLTSVTIPRATTLGDGAFDAGVRITRR